MADTKRYPPGPKSFLPGGAYFSLHRDPLGFMQRVVQEYGDIVHLQLGPRHDYLVNHPDYIRAVLQCPEGMRRSLPRALRKLMGNGLLCCPDSVHRERRRLLQPSFSRQQIAVYAAGITACALRASARWSHGKTLDIAHEMLRLSLAVVVQTLFHVDRDKEAAEISELVDVIVETTNKETVPFLDQLLAKLPLPRERRFQRACEQLRGVIAQVIRQRQGTDLGHPDLLSRLLRLRDETEKRSLSDAEVLDEAVTMFGAGHETIGTAMAWTWYLLALHPEAEAQVHAELDTVLDGRIPCAEDLDQLVNCSKVFSESMRLYPPVWLMVRRPLVDFPMGGYVVPAGSYIHMSQYLMHRDPRYFPDPQRFDPERWTREASLSRPSYSYFPFGGGPRKCIGEGFAWMEGLLVLATLAQQWRLRAVPGQRIELEPLITLRPKYGIAMTIEQRERDRTGAPDPARFAGAPGQPQPAAS